MFHVPGLGSSGHLGDHRMLSHPYIYHVYIQSYVAIYLLSLNICKYPKVRDSQIHNASKSCRSNRDVHQTSPGKTKQNPTLRIKPSQTGLCLEMSINEKWMASFPTKWRGNEQQGAKHAGCFDESWKTCRLHDVKTNNMSKQLWVTRVKDVTATFNDVYRRFGTAAVVYPDMAIFIEEWLL